MLAFEHWSAGEAAFKRNEQPTIVTRVEFASECNVPAARVAKGWDRGGYAINDPQVGLVEEFWDCKVFLAG